MSILVSLPLIILILLIMAFHPLILNILEFFLHFFVQLRNFLPQPIWDGYHIALIRNDWVALHSILDLINFEIYFIACTSNLINFVKWADFSGFSFMFSASPLTFTTLGITFALPFFYSWGWLSSSVCYSSDFILFRYISWIAAHSA